MQTRFSSIGSSSCDLPQRSVSIIPCVCDLGDDCAHVRARPKRGGCPMEAMPITDALFLSMESRERPFHVGSLQLFRQPEGRGHDDMQAFYRQSLEVKADDEDL